MLLTHELPRVRAQALRALAVAGDTQHVELVRDRLEDDDEAVRRQAERALKQMATRMDVEPGCGSQMRDCSKWPRARPQTALSETSAGPSASTSSFLPNMP